MGQLSVTGKRLVNHSGTGLPTKRGVISAWWVIFHNFHVICRFFQNKLFQKNISGIPSECQTVWIHIRIGAWPGSKKFELVISKKNVRDVHSYKKTNIELPPFYHKQLSFLLIFFQVNFSKKSLRNTINVSNILVQDLTRHFSRPDRGPNCL